MAIIEPVEQKETTSNLGVEPRRSLRIKVEATLFIVFSTVIVVGYLIQYFIVYPSRQDSEFFDNFNQSLLAQFGIALALLFLLIGLFRTVIMNPLQLLTRHMSGINPAGNLSARLNMKREDEIGALADTLDNLVGTLETDIEKRKRTEAALRESEERYALAVRGANDGLWDWNLVNGTMHFSHRWKTMLGFEEDEIADDPEKEWFPRIHRDDVENVRAALAAHLKGQTSHFESEHRIRHRDKTYLWVLCRGIAVRDESGKPTRMAGSQTDITPRKIIEEQLSYQALHDSLTALPNRALLIDRVNQAIRHARRNTDYRFAVLFLDLDRFKVINDSLGHVVGDTLLQAVGEKLTECLRETDTVSRNSGTVARFGGDEFVLLLDNVRGLQDVITVAERIHQVLEAPFMIEGNEVFTTASIGLALSSEVEQSAEEIVRSADTAMYRAKGEGKARYAVFDQDMHSKAMERMKLENDMRRAVEREEFLVYYQPIVNLETGRITAFEALVRWEHPERGLVSPAEFIPMAEETEMIIPIGQMVMKEACRQARRWQKELTNCEALQMSVNLSVKDFGRKDLVEQIEATLRDTELDPHALKLEITESAIMESVEFVQTSLRKLRSMGVQLSIDDFGTGYSSLSYLHRFPMNTLKVDRAFVRDMQATPESLHIVRTIVLLAKALGMTVIAEGVEDDYQLRMLRELQCDYGQGYYFAKPLTKDDATQMLQSWPHW